MAASDDDRPCRRVEDERAWCPRAAQLTQDGQTFLRCRVRDTGPDPGPGDTLILDNPGAHMPEGVCKAVKAAGSRARVPPNPARLRSTPSGATATDRSAGDPSARLRQVQRAPTQRRSPRRQQSLGRDPHNLHTVLGPRRPATTPRLPGTRMTLRLHADRAPL